MAKTDDLQAWRSFIVFARSGTLTAAAKALETEPSSISRAISGLERTLGVELIRHGVRPLVLTDAGRMAHKRMETILRAHDSLMDALKDDNRTLEGKIRLSSAPGFAARHLTTLLQRFQIEHPGITVEILAGLKEADVQKGLCEVATLTGIPTLPNLVYEPRAKCLRSCGQSGLHCSVRHAREARGSAPSFGLHLLRTGTPGDEGASARQ